MSYLILARVQENCDPQCTPWYPNLGLLLISKLFVSMAAVKAVGSVIPTVYFMYYIFCYSRVSLLRACCCVYAISATAAAAFCHWWLWRCCVVSFVGMSTGKYICVVQPLLLPAL